MKAWNPNEFVMEFAGLTFTSGFADGEFFTAEPVTDTVDSVAGTDGEVVISVNTDSRWNIEIKFLSSSDENAKMAALWNLRKRAGGTVGVAPFLARNPNSGETLSGANAVIVAPPKMSADRLDTERVWKILLTDGEYSHGL